MNYDIYSQEIQDCINKIRKTRSTDVKIILSCCQQLLDYGKKYNDSQLLGFSYYYIAEAYYFSGDSQKQLVSLFNALEYLKISQDHGLLARSYNLLGILSNTQGNPGSALDYYLQGLAICSSHNLDYVTGMIYSNISTLFSEVGNHKKAIEFLEKAIENYNKPVPTQALISNLTSSYLALGQSYLHLENLSEAIKCMEKAEKYLPQIPIEDIGITIFVFKAMLADVLGNTVERDACIQEIVAMSLQEYSLLTFYDDFLTLLHFLQNIGKDKALMEIIEPLEDMAVKDGNLHIQLELVKVKLDYYQRTNQDFLFLHTARQFYNLSLKQEAENQKNISASIDLRFSLLELQKQQKKIKAENQRLIIKSESDALTGLPNRYKLNDYADTLLTKAFHNQVPFTVEILDIDYFKQYNDTYGHPAGDECLKAIARELDVITSEDVFCARYGGDEFIILYYNKTEKEVMTLAELLRQRICDLQIEHKNSLAEPFVTITQGIALRIPNSGNRMWDFLHIADNALYDGKRNCRNSITIKSF